MRAHHVFFFFFNDTATTEIYTLSLHDALPILGPGLAPQLPGAEPAAAADHRPARAIDPARLDRPQSRSVVPGLRRRSEEHTSELQSRQYLVCRLLLEKKKYKYKMYHLIYLEYI